MKINEPDAAILDELEKLVGWKIPRSQVALGVPRLNSSLVQRQEHGKMELPREASMERVDRVIESQIPFFAGLGALVDDFGRVVALNLTGLGLQTIPDAIWKLEALRTIGLCDNLLEAIPDEVFNSKSLKRVGFLENKIREIPPRLLSSPFALYLSKLQDFPESYIVVGRNPLLSPPPEIIDRGMAAVRAYFESLSDAIQPLNEVKVLLVGEGGSGKTSLVKRLLAKAFNEQEAQTHGINIDVLPFAYTGRDVRLNIWDFGGQEIMHATHLFFLSRRSLYVLVLDGRKEEDAEYWLKHIESFGGDSPILVVLNKMDENPSFDLNRRFLQNKYKGIVNFYRLSCKVRNDAGFRKFEDGLREGLQKVPIIQTNWPRKWFEIKTELENAKDQFIDVDEYENICTKKGVSEPEQQENLVQFLHDLGSVVHFPDFSLHHMHVLEPRWLTHAVYKIITSPELAENKGMLPLASIQAILRGEREGFSYPKKTHTFILELMRKFELCYLLDENHVLVPNLLEVQEPKIDFDYDKSVRFRLDYEFLPKSIIPRFIVKKNKDIKGTLRWRTGVVLASATFGAVAVIKADESAKRIYISISGDQPRDYLTVLRTAFLEIHQGFEKLVVKEKVCLPDAPEVTVSFDHLVRLEKEGRAEVYPDDATHPYKVADLLGVVSVRNVSQEDFLKLLRHVLSENDTKESALEKANKIFMLQPNFAGIGIDLNAFVEKFFKRKPSGKDAATAKD